MTSQFWQVEESPGQILAELQKDKPSASLWDIFQDYSPKYNDTKPADTSEEWLGKQAQLVEQIIGEQLSDNTFDRYELDAFLDSLDTQLIPEDEADIGIDVEDTKYDELSKLIAEKYIAPLGLNENTLVNFLDALETKLIEPNKELIEKQEREQTEQFIRDMYPPEQANEILKNADFSLDDDSEEEDDDNTENENFDNFMYQQIDLAISDTFFGDDDAGAMAYEEQEKLALEKFEHLKAEISEILNQSPDPQLHPHSIDTSKMDSDDFDWGAYYQAMEVNSFAHEFDGVFTAWKGDGKVLFLSAMKEDKELPYQITLGGLSLDKYNEVLASYNEIVKKLS